MTQWKPVGASGQTPGKQRILREIVKTNLLISAGASRSGKGQDWIPKKDFVRFIDLNAGSGRYIHGDTEIKGSPEIAYEEAFRIVQLPKFKGTTFLFELFENNPSTAQELSVNMERINMELFPRSLLSLIGSDVAKPSIEVIVKNMSNQDGLIEIANSITERHCGLIYSDPNGYIDCPFSQISSFSLLSHNSAMDVLININATSLKRDRLSKLSLRNEEIDDLMSRIKGIQKRFWQISQPATAHQWTFLLGTNTNILPQFERLGFIDLCSAEGQRRLRSINYTKSELDSDGECA